MARGRSVEKRTWGLRSSMRACCFAPRAKAHGCLVSSGRGRGIHTGYEKDFYLILRSIHIYPSVGCKHRATFYPLEVLHYTCSPISSANGNTNKSPTVDTVAFPSSNDPAACTISVSCLKAIRMHLFNQTYLFNRIFSDAINCVCNTMELRGFTTLN